MRQQIGRVLIVIAWAMFAAPLSVATAQQRPAPASGGELLQRMHDAYEGRWFHTLTFVQRTTIRRPDGTTQASTWYEAMLAPDRLRIDFGEPSEGNGALTTADSTYVVRGGKVVRTVGEGNPFVPFVAGVYAQPVERTVQQLEPYDFDMTRVRRDAWQGRSVFVVGARDSADLKSPQFWVDADRLVLVRMILPLRRGTEERTEDIHLDRYVQLGHGWLATRVVMYDGAVARQTEEYRDWHSDMPLDGRLFDAGQWSAVPHWTASGERGTGAR